MDKQELKKLKKAYKKAVVLEKAEAADLEQQLMAELGEGWEPFLADVTAYVEAVRKLGEEAYRCALNADGFGLAPPEAEKLLAAAKNMGALPDARRSAGRKTRRSRACGKGSAVQFQVKERRLIKWRKREIKWQKTMS